MIKSTRVTMHVYIELTPGGDKYFHFEYSLVSDFS